jgi:hypothetical protein
MRYSILLTFFASALASASPPAEPTAKPLPLPGATDAGVLMDYLAYDSAQHRVWAPGGNTGNVYVVDAATQHVNTLSGFATAEVERKGKKRTIGPSSAAAAEGTVYVGNRADASICAVNAASLQKGACLKLESAPDGLAYVASAKELWATTPKDNSLTLLDASKGPLTLKAKVKLEGGPEGFAVDDTRGVFYTNLEDKDRTLAIDVKTRKVLHDWPAGCGSEGPRGLAIDTKDNLLFVACNTGAVHTLAVAQDGKAVSTLQTGEGVDNIDYLASKRLLAVGAGKAANLWVARVEADGKLVSLNKVATAPGARNPVLTEKGATYLTDSAGGRLLVVPEK